MKEEPALPPHHSLSPVTSFPEAGQGMHSGEICSFQTEQVFRARTAGHSLAGGPVGLGVYMKVPGPLHCAPALGRRWQLWTDIFSSPT